MKIQRNVLIIFSILCIFLITGCNSAIYEIIEVEEPVEIKPEKTVVEDIKEDIVEVKEEPQITDNKFTDKQQVAKTFAIQIGAFTKERNANRFTDRAIRNLSDQGVYCKNIDGLYKVRMGTFNDIAEANVLLETLKQMGYHDSFVVELTYFK